MLRAKSDYPRTLNVCTSCLSLRKMMPFLNSQHCTSRVQHEKSNQCCHYVQFHCLKAYSRKRSVWYLCGCWLLCSLQSRNRPNPTRHPHHHPNQTTAKMPFVERLLKQETWFKWMQFQNKAIIHSTAITDSLFIDIVQFIFDVYCKIRQCG